MISSTNSPPLTLDKWTLASELSQQEHYTSYFIPNILRWGHRCTPHQNGFLNDYIDTPEDYTEDKIKEAHDKLKLPASPTAPNPADILATNLAFYQIQLTLAKNNRDEILQMRSTIAAGLLVILNSLDDHTRRMLFPTDTSENDATIHGILKSLRLHFNAADPVDVDNNREKLRIALAGPDKQSWLELLHRHRECHHRANRQGMPITDAEQAYHLRKAIMSSAHAPIFHSQLNILDMSNRDASILDFQTLVNALQHVQFTSATTSTDYVANAASNPTANAATPTPRPNPPPRPNNHRNPQFPPRPNNFPRPQAFPRPYQPPRQQNTRPPRPPAAQPPRTFANTYFCWSHGDGHSSEFCRTPEDDHLDYLTNTTPQQIAHRRAELPAIRAAIAASRQR